MPTIKKEIILKVGKKQMAKPGDKVDVIKKWQGKEGFFYLVRHRNSEKPPFDVSEKDLIL